LQQQMRDDLDTLAYYAQAANPSAGLDRQRLNELKAQIERCCPPPRTTPACKYTPCERPDKPKEPHIPDVKPPDKPNKPVG
jgi:hypothetical protein